MNVAPGAIANMTNRTRPAEKAPKPKAEAKEEEEGFTAEEYVYELRPLELVVLNSLSVDCLGLTTVCAEYLELPYSTVDGIVARFKSDCEEYGLDPSATMKVVVKTASVMEEARSKLLMS